MRFAPGAYRWASLPLLVGVAVGLLYPVVAVAGALFGAGVLLFFRDPDRTPPPEGVVSPADGRVSVVREEDDRLRVGVFMNVTDVHVNRAPMAGEVRAVEHAAGGHWPAFSKASERNERRTITFEEFQVVLIAGTVARRTHSYVEPGDSLERGERLGHIAFGSRVDVVFPERFERADLHVEEGDPLLAGESVLADDPDTAGDEASTDDAVADDSVAVDPERAGDGPPADDGSPADDT